MTIRCIKSVIEGDPNKKFFAPEFHPKLKHNKKGIVSFATISTSANTPLAASQFFITLVDNLDYLDGKHAVFGHVVEGIYMPLMLQIHFYLLNIDKVLKFLML